MQKSSTFGQVTYLSFQLSNYPNAPNPVIQRYSFRIVNKIGMFLGYPTHEPNDAGMHEVDYASFGLT